jgi:general secretion pathway protein G
VSGIATLPTSGESAIGVDSWEVKDPLGSSRRVGESGISLLEVMIVAAILAVVAMIGVPMYQSALRIARIQKAKQELMLISHTIDSFRATYDRLPFSLAEVGHGGRLDPWGVPYAYLNYSSGTGDGLEWAIDAGLVDPSAFIPGDGDEALVDVGYEEDDDDDDDDESPRGRSGSNGIGGLVSEQASGMSGKELALWIRELKEGGDVASEGEIEPLAQALAGHSIYVGVPTEEVRRRDRYLYPLNTDYDLFSLGPNGRTAVALGDSVANDDVIRANDGGYFGSASKY